MTIFRFHLDVIYLSAIGYNARKIVELLTTMIYPDAPKKLARDLVRDIRANWKEEIEVLKKSGWKEMGSVQRRAVLRLAKKLI